MLYENRDYITNVASTSWNEGISAGYQEVKSDINNQIYHFNQLSDYDKGSYCGMGAAALLPGKASKNPLSSKCLRNNVGRTKNTFPKNPDNLLPNLPRDSKGRIYAADNIRIRPESHPLKSNEVYSPRYHGLHYHIETRNDPTLSWNNRKNIVIIKPKDYTHGSGTGFLPGEQFPGA